jgi:hypothetical protein
MKRVLIMEMQGRKLVGPSAKTERALARIAVGGTAPPRIRRGAHLVGEWNERTYQVEVLEDGFVMDGKTSRPLSALARHITGALVGPALLRAQLMRRIRCAIYTRKSSEGGLKQDFNSLDAQREACEASISAARNRKAGCCCQTIMITEASRAVIRTARRCSG